MACKTGEDWAAVLDIAGARARSAIPEAGAAKELPWPLHRLQSVTSLSTQTYLCSGPLVSHWLNPPLITSYFSEPCPSRFLLCLESCFQPFGLKVTKAHVRKWTGRLMSCQLDILVEPRYSEGPQNWQKWGIFQKAVFLLFCFSSWAYPGCVEYGRPLSVFHKHPNLQWLGFELPTNYQTESFWETAAKPFPQVLTLTFQISAWGLSGNPRCHWKLLRNYYGVI